MPEREDRPIYLATVLALAAGVAAFLIAHSQYLC
jgi:hypothetical protein